MNLMISKYNQSILLIFVFSFCLNFFAGGQTPAPDSSDTKKNNPVNIAYGTQDGW
jgi:hypothetical protein